jgi:hypothetical protein
MPERAIGAGDRGHCLGLVDRTEQCLAHRHIVEGRMQMVEAQDAHGCRKLGDDSDVAITGERLDLVGERDLPPVDFAAAQCGHRRKIIQCQPLDPIEMRDLWPGGEAHGSAPSGLVEREAFVCGAGAADVLFGQEAIGTAADDFGDGLKG